MNPTEIWTQGGTFPLIAMVLVIAGCTIASVGTLWVGFAQKRFAVSALWLGLTGAVVTAAIAVWLGASMVTDAAEIANFDTRQVVQAQGISQAVFTQIGAFMMLAPAFMVLCALSSIPGAARRSDDSVFDVGSFAGAMVGALAGTAISAAYVLVLIGQGAESIGPSLVVLPVMTAIGVAAILVSSMRISLLNVNQQAWTLGLRALTMTSAALAVLFAGQLFGSIDEWATFIAVAISAAADKAEVLQVGLDNANWPRTLAWFMVPPIVLSGLGSLFPILKRADRRTAWGLAITSTQVVVMGAALLFIHFIMSGVFEVIHLQHSLP